MMILQFAGFGKENILEISKAWRSHSSTTGSKKISALDELPLGLAALLIQNCSPG